MHNIWTYHDRCMHVAGKQPAKYKKDFDQSFIPKQNDPSSTPPFTNNGPWSIAATNMHEIHSMYRWYQSGLCRYFTVHGNLWTNQDNKHFVKCHVLAEAKLCYITDYNPERLDDWPNWILCMPEMVSYPHAAICVQGRKHMPRGHGGHSAFVRREGLICQLKSKKSHKDMLESGNYLKDVKRV